MGSQLVTQTAPLGGYGTQGAAFGTQGGGYAGASQQISAPYSQARLRAELLRPPPFVFQEHLFPLAHSPGVNKLARRFETVKRDVFSFSRLRGC